MSKVIKPKLAKAMESAIVTKDPSESIVSSGYYDDKDLLKHYIRKKYWLKRIESLKRDCSSMIPDGIKYFAFCSRFAYDVRYFANKNLLDNSYLTSIPFVFVEFLKDDFDFLQEQFLKRHSKGMGFYGSLADISTDTRHKDYGKFWSTFPFDVINLDYLGDILKSGSSSGKIGANDFYAIHAIILNQSLLRRPYELWITMRAKSGRFDPSIKNEFRQLVRHNIKNYSDTFGEKFKASFGDSVDTLEDDSLFLIGYLKWLWYVCKTSFSVINPKKLKVIKYSRKDKDGEEYFLYNIFLRIEPYDQIVMPSPASSAAEHCEAEYMNGIKECFFEPVDVTAEFASLSTADKKSLQDELTHLHKEFLEDESGWIK